MIVNVLLTLVVVAAVCVSSVWGNVKIDTTSRSFVDEHGRTLIFHGMNAVYKLPPYYPTVSGFDTTSTLSDVDAANLARWGFNIVRLGVMWPGVEPGSRGQYDQGYLDQIEIIVNNLAKKNIRVILDLHQDLFHRKFCGEGVPDYVYSICKLNEPAGTKQFPMPAVRAEYPVDEEGNPTLESCLSVGFGTYYLSAEVGAAFQCLYDNVENLWDAYAGFWKTVATRFASFDNVLGYELLNEPWAGDVYTSPKNLLPQVVEKTYLQPMYEYATKAIREVDDQKIVFFEGLTIDYWPNGFSAGPGGAEYNDRQALAYHIYCPLQNTTTAVRQLACDGVDDFFFTMRKRDADRMGVGMIMTEFGAAEAIKSDLTLLTRTAAYADKFQQSWMYWQFKYYQDITTCTPQGESLYNDDGSVCDEKIDVLSRTYPQAVAGSLKSFEFDIHTKLFRMEYSPWSDADSFTSKLATTTAVTSSIYVNKDRSYPHGVSVLLTMSSDDDSNSADVLSISCPDSRSSSSNANVVTITQQGVVGTNTVASVVIAPCNNLNIEKCTCRWA